MLPWITALQLPLLLTSNTSWWEGLGPPRLHYCLPATQAGGKGWGHRGYITAYQQHKLVGGAGATEVVYTHVDIW